MKYANRIDQEYDLAGNTLYMIAGRVLAAILTAIMAGYAFGRINFKRKNIAFSLVLFQMMVPA